MRILCTVATMALLLVPMATQALTVAPLRHTVTIDPDDTRIVPLFVINDEAEPITVTPEATLFVVDEETGQPIFGGESETLSWIVPDIQSLALEPGAEGQINFFIHPDAAAIPGAHYFALFARAAPDDGQVGIGTRVGSLLFLHIAGDITETLVPLAFEADNSRYRKGPAGVRMHVRNDGNIHLIPKGTVAASSWFGAELYTTPLNPDDSKILAHTDMIRNYSNIDLPFWAVGPVDVQMHVTYGVGQKVFTEQTRFWYVPTWVYVLFSGMGLLLILFIADRFATKQKK